MDKIVELLKKLDNKVTPNIAKRVDGLRNLESRYDLAKKELGANPDDEELQEGLQEITDYLDDYRDDLVEDLEELLEQKTNSNNNPPKTEEKPKAGTSPNGEEKPTEEKPTEKKSTNIAGFIIGGVLLVASLGAINYFRNNR